MYMANTSGWIHVTGQVILNVHIITLSFPRIHHATDDSMIIALSTWCLLSHYLSIPTIHQIKLYSKQIPNYISILLSLGGMFGSNVHHVRLWVFLYPHDSKHTTFESGHDKLRISNSTQHAICTGVASKGRGLVHYAITKPSPTLQIKKQIPLPTKLKISGYDLPKVSGALC